MITLAPGDTLYIVPGAGVPIIATAWGETIPVGGGTPAPQILGVANAATANTWTAIYTAPAGYQALVNGIHLVNNAVSGAVRCAINVIPSGQSTPGAQVAGPSSLNIPQSGSASYGRDGWRVYNGNGVPVERQVYARGSVAANVNIGATQAVLPFSLVSAVGVSAVASGAGNALVPSVAGWYRIDAEISTQPYSGSAMYAQLMIYVNAGATVGGVPAETYQASMSYATLRAYDLFQLAAGDQVTFQTYSQAALKTNAGVVTMMRMSP